MSNLGQIISVLPPVYIIGVALGLAIYIILAFGNGIMKMYKDLADVYRKRYEEEKDEVENDETKMEELIAENEKLVLKNQELTRLLAIGSTQQSITPQRADDTREKIDEILQHLIDLKNGYEMSSIDEKEGE